MIGLFLNINIDLSRNFNRCEGFQTGSENQIGYLEVTEVFFPNGIDGETKAAVYIAFPYGQSQLEVKTHPVWSKHVKCDMVEAERRCCKVSSCSSHVRAP